MRLETSPFCSDLVDDTSLDTFITLFVVNINGQSCFTVSIGHFLCCKNDLFAASDIKQMV